MTYKIFKCNMLYQNSFLKIFVEQIKIRLDSFQHWKSAEIVNFLHCTLKTYSNGRVREKFFGIREIYLSSFNLN